MVGGGWPRNPLDANYDCTRELSAYFVGKTREGDFGLPYQLETLRTNGLGATYFVDPLFSFALGLDPLADVVGSIERAGQAVALHLHPEWLTDPRCVGLPAFRGPYLSQYGPDDQRVLIRAGMRRLVEAGARPLPVFRAGSWGADVSTASRAARRRNPGRQQPERRSCGFIPFPGVEVRTAGSNFTARCD